MKFFVSTISMGLLCLSVHVNAADTGRVAELFWCTFNDDKGWSEFEQVNKYFGDQVKKVGGKADDFDAYVWQPFRANVDFDYLWNGYYDNLRVWGEASQAYLDSAEGAAADDRWEELETCGSALANVEMIFDSPDYPVADSTSKKGMLESFRCKLQPGKTLADVNAVIKDWHKHINALGIPMDVYMRTPLVSGNDEITHTYFAVHENAAAYGRNVSAYQTHPGTAAIDKKLSEVQTCTNALWQSWQVFEGNN